jgi:hypothetical protein
MDSTEQLVPETNEETNGLFTSFDEALIHRMNKQAISLTLSPNNLLWLHDRAIRARTRSLSETLDRILDDARLSSGWASGPSRSVVGTLRISESDPDLARADQAIRTLFAASLDTTSAARVRHPKRAPKAGALRGRRGRPPRTRPSSRG